MMLTLSWANKADAPNPAMALLFHIAHPLRRAGDLPRSAASHEILK